MSSQTANLVENKRSYNMYNISMTATMLNKKTNEKERSMSNKLCERPCSPVFEGQCLEKLPLSSFLYAENPPAALLSSLQVYPQVLGYMPPPKTSCLPLRTRHFFVRAPSCMIIIYNKLGSRLCAGDSIGAVVHLRVGLTRSHEVGLGVALGL